MKVKVVVNDKMQEGYQYYLVEPEGENFRVGFEPELSPKQMLRLGVFGGKYMTDCRDEFPRSWFNEARLSPKGFDKSLNYFGVRAGLSLAEWREKGWIYRDDPRGWFQWYCRYYRGRRIPDEDERQIKRWRLFKRHLVALRKACIKGDLGCRRRQRQALLQWGYDTTKE